MIMQMHVMYVRMCHTDDTGIVAVTKLRLLLLNLVISCLLNDWLLWLM